MQLILYKLIKLKYLFFYSKSIKKYIGKNINLRKTNKPLILLYTY